MWMLRLRSICKRNRLERELDDELQFHLDRQIEENIAAGMGIAEARHAALRAFGGLDQRKEECRDARRVNMFDNFVQDLRYALRGLGRDPMLAATAALILAISIGANTTVFSLVNSILLRPLPYPDSRRVYWIAERMGRDQMEVGLGPDYYSLREENRIFEDVGAYDTTTLNWSGSEKPEQLDAAQVTASFFRVLAAQPMLGRYLAAGEEGKKAPPVVVLSYTFWRSRLGSNPRVVGKTVTLDGLPNTVIGVMPQGFDYPHGTQIWKPLDIEEAEQRPRSVTRPMQFINMLARVKTLKTGSEAPRLDAEMARLTRTIRTEYPKAFETAGFLNGMRISAAPLQQRMTGDLRPALLVLTGAVGLVLLIACANLANLLLARATARRRELAVRMALGSGRSRIVRQVLTESLALALPGGLAGIAVAWLAVAALNAWKPLVLASYPRISIDLPTLVFTFGLTLVTALAFGLAPALAAAGISIQEALKSGGHTHSGGRRATRLRQFLVVAELGVSLVLLIGAGLLARSFLKLSRTDLGFPAENLLTMRLNLTGSRYRTAESQVGFYQDVLGRVGRLPGVRLAAVATDLPLSGEGAFQGMAFTVEGRPPVPMAQRPSTDVTVVSPEFFRTMEIPLRSGRFFDWRDNSTSSDRVLVNEVFARRIFPGEEALRPGHHGAGRHRAVDHYGCRGQYPRECARSGAAVGAVSLHLSKARSVSFPDEVDREDRRRSALRNQNGGRTGLCGGPRSARFRRQDHGRTLG